MTESPPRRILVLARKQLGGIHVFWQNVGRGDAAVDVLRYRDGEKTAFDSETGEFIINPFDPLLRVYQALRRHIRWQDYATFLANERFELAFLAWVAPPQPVCFIAHVNHPDTYAAIHEFAPTIDQVFCVSDVAVAHLRARGFARAVFFRYAVFLPAPTDRPKQRKVVYVGRFEPDKNLVETMDLMALFRDAGYAVRMIGDGSMAAEVTAALAPEEALVGVPRETVLQELNEASFLCHNSYVEGLPIIHMEAMHYRLGVICNYVDKSVNEVLGPNALLWSDRDREGLLQRMQSFRFSPPSGASRTNNPALNETFLNEVRAVRRHSDSRHSVPPRSFLDRQTWLPSSWVAAFRAWRWQRRR